ncbi:hypothetical protein C8T65DRAFT_703810, partial [Cerioporus squamosus]
MEGLLEAPSHTTAWRASQRAVHTWGYGPPALACAMYGGPLRGPLAHSGFIRLHSHAVCIEGLSEARLRTAVPSACTCVPYTWRASQRPPRAQQHGGPLRGLFTHGGTRPARAQRFHSPALACRVHRGPLRGPLAHSSSIRLHLRALYMEGLSEAPSRTTAWRASQRAVHTWGYGPPALACAMYGGPLRGPLAHSGFIRLQSHAVCIEGLSEARLCTAVPSACTCMP